MAGSGIGVGVGEGGGVGVGVAGRDVDAVVVTCTVVEAIVLDARVGAFVVTVVLAVVLLPALPLPEPTFTPRCQRRYGNVDVAVELAVPTVEEVEVTGMSGLSMGPHRSSKRA